MSDRWTYHNQNEDYELFFDMKPTGTHMPWGKHEYLEETCIMFNNYEATHVPSRPPVDSVGVDKEILDILVDYGERVVDDPPGIELLAEEPAKALAALMGRAPVDSVGVDGEKVLNAYECVDAVQKQFPEPLTRREKGMIGHARAVIVAALTAPADGKPCKTCRETGEHHPDCTPSTEEDT